MYQREIQLETDLPQDLQRLDYYRVQALEKKNSVLKDTLHTFLRIANTWKINQGIGY